MEEYHGEAHRNMMIRTVDMKKLAKYYLLIIFFGIWSTTMASDKTNNSPSMLFNLNGKTVIVTGASQGIGKQFANVLNKAGARVILASRNIEKLNEFSKNLHNTKAIQMDIANSASVKEAFFQLEKAGEKIDICINNAATVARTPIFSENSNDDFESLIQTNVMGVWYVTKAAAIHMKNNGIHGSIINIGSINGDSFPYKELTAYAVSKAAVIHMTKSLVNELSEYKIRINTINPGPIQSDLLGSQTKHDPEFWKDKIPAGFIAKPSDLDGLILYLASNDASRYVTGATFTIDGGISWRGKSW